MGDGHYNDYGALRDGLESDWQIQQRRAIDKIEGGKVGGGTQAGTMAGSSFILIAILIVPVLLAKLAGFIWGLTFKLKTFGRVIQSALTGFVIGVMVLVGVTAIIENFLGFNFDSLALNSAVIIGTVFILSLVCGLSALLYFCFIYPIWKHIGIFAFSNLVKNTFIFPWVGVWVGSFIGSFVGSWSVTNGILLISFILGIIFCAIRTLVYAKTSNGEREVLPKAPIAALISLGLTFGIVFWFSMSSLGWTPEARAEYAERRQRRYVATEQAKEREIEIRSEFDHIVQGLAANQAVVITDTEIYSQIVRMSSNFVTEVKKGDIVIITGKNNRGWLPVTFGNYSGYIPEGQVLTKSK